MVPAVVLATLLLIAAKSATAQEYLPEYAGLAPMSWAAGESYSAAAQGIGRRFLNRTHKEDTISVEDFSARVGDDLESSLEQRLASQQQREQAVAGPTGRAPTGSGLTDK
jgi:hypothetical protein